MQVHLQASFRLAFTPVLRYTKTNCVVQNGSFKRAYGNFCFALTSLWCKYILHSKDKWHSAYLPSKCYSRCLMHSFFCKKMKTKGAIVDPKRKMSLGNSRKNFTTLQKKKRIVTALMCIIRVIRQGWTTRQGCDVHIWEQKQPAANSKKKKKQPKKVYKLWRKRNVWELLSLQMEDEIICCITAAGNDYCHFNLLFTKRWTSGV